MEVNREKENIVNPAGIAVSHKLGGYGLPGTGTRADTSTTTAKAGTARLSGRDDYLGGSL